VRLHHNIIVTLVIILGIGIFAQTVFAAPKTVNSAPSYLEQVRGRSGVEKTDIPVFAGQAIKAVLGITAMLFFVLMVYAGIRWMTARGEEESIKKAWGTLTTAGIGLVVIVSAFAITNFVTDRIIEGNSSDQLGAGLNGNLDGFGCCLDHVGQEQTPGALIPEFRQTSWNWRITTFQDCQYRGETKLSDDALVGPRGVAWEYIAVTSKDQCQQEWNTWCTSHECSSLGFTK